MKFLNIDQHIGVIGDIKNIFNNLGHSVMSYNLSGHCGLLGMPRASIPEMSGDSWCTVIGQRRFDEFYSKYIAPIEHLYDGFICTFPPVFSMLYARSKKPIIIQIPIRYEYGFDGDPAGWEELSEYLRQGVDDGRIFLCANSRYDKKYTETFLKRHVEYIPSLCEYTGMTYNPVIDRSIFYSNPSIDVSSEKIVRKHSILSAGHSWQSVSEFMLAIHFPYQVSTMSIFEQYTACMPMAFPTKRFMMELYDTSQRTVLDQISHSRQGERCGSPVMLDYEFDPNNWKDYNSVNHWVDFADYYQQDEFPYLLYFDSFEQVKLLANTNIKTLLGISNLMRQANTQRKERIYTSWKKLLVKVEEKIG